MSGFCVLIALRQATEQLDDKTPIAKKREVAGDISTVGYKWEFVIQI